MNRKILSIVALLFSFTIACGQVSPSQMNADGTGSWTSPLTVIQAISSQNGSTQTVEGFIVGQPTSTTKVVTSNFPNDYAFALADTSTELNTSNMIYVQIPSSFRTSFGLKSNPDLLGEKIKVTGSLAAYFSHPGLKSATAFELIGEDDPTDPPPSEPEDPVDPPPAYEEYYSDAEGKTGLSLEESTP